MVSSIHPLRPELRSREEQFSALSRERRTVKKWEMRLGIRQIAFLWLSMILLMFVVFVFGVQAGRNQGVSTALEEYSEQAVRLPVAQPLALAENGNDTFSGSVESALAAGSRTNAKTSPVQLKNESQAAPQYDFSASKNSPAVRIEEAQESEAEQSLTPGEVAAGFGAKPAGEIAREPAADQNQTEVKKPDVIKTTVEEKPVKEKERAKHESTARALAPVTKPEPEKPAKPLENTELSGGWYVQVAATGAESEAQTLAGRISRLKVPYVVERARIGSRTFFRVVAGPYSTKEQANAVKERVKKSNAVKGEPFLKFVKS